MCSRKTTTNLKKRQRAVNAAVRKLNKNIKNDAVWKGRFYAIQTERYFYKSRDNKLQVFYYLEFIDKQTNIRISRWYPEAIFEEENSWYLLEAMNDFINVICKANKFI